VLFLLRDTVLVMEISVIWGFIRHVVRKLVTGMQTQPLKEGTRAPDFVARDESGNEHRLSQYSGKHVVLWFFPRANTPG